MQTLPRPEPTIQPATTVLDQAPEALRERMTQFEDALRAEDTAAFLRLFSRSKPWRDINTLDDSTAAKLVTFERLANELRSKRGLYETLFDSGGDDCLRDYVMGEYAKPWRWLGDGKFVPADLDGSTVWVRWRRDRSEWVVDEIAQSSA